MLARLLCGVVWVVLVTGGCSADSSGDDDGEELRATCLRWQDAMCDLDERCGVLSSREECDDTYRSIRCRDDGSAQICLDQLRSATCGSALPSCRLERVADRAPAVAACDTLSAEVCKVDIRCGRPITQADCEAQRRQALDCDSAIGVRTEFDSCLVAVGGMDCSAALPESCSGVLKLQHE